jgi:hypothetical protein
MIKREFDSRVGVESLGCEIVVGEFDAGAQGLPTFTPEHQNLVRAEK